MAEYHGPHEGLFLRTLNQGTACAYGCVALIIVFAVLMVLLGAALELLGVNF